MSICTQNMFPGSCGGDMRQRCGGSTCLISPPEQAVCGNGVCEVPLRQYENMTLCDVVMMRCNAMQRLMQSML